MIRHYWSDLLGKPSEKDILTNYRLYKQMEKDNLFLDDFDNMLYSRNEEIAIQLLLPFMDTEKIDVKR